MQSQNDLISAALRGKLELHAGAHTCNPSTSEVSRVAFGGRSGVRGQSYLHVKSAGRQGFMRPVPEADGQDANVEFAYGATLGSNTFDS